jgi:hypothetical protein
MISQEINKLLVVIRGNRIGAQSCILYNTYYARFRTIEVNANIFPF